MSLKSQWNCESGSFARVLVTEYLMFVLSGETWIVLTLDIPSDWRMVFLTSGEAVAVKAVIGTVLGTNDLTSAIQL